MVSPSPEPLVTTVIPTYRRPRLLRRAVLSALGQAYPHVRVCVCDNASGDETAAVIAELVRRDSRVQYHRHRENMGSYNNFNYGIRCVETPYFSLLSDDDVLAPGFYERAVRALERYPEAMFVCMPTMVVDTALRVISAPISFDGERYYQQGEAVRGMLEGTIPGTWTGIVFRREARDEVGFIDTTVGPHADGGFVYHVAARFPGVAVPGVAAVLMSHEESVSGTSGAVTGEWIGWWNSMMRKIYEDKNVPEHVRDYIRKVSHPNYLAIGVKQVGRALASGRFAHASLAARGVKECGHPCAGVFLDMLIWCGEYLHADLLLKAVKGIRDVLLRGKVQILHARYGVLAGFVQQYTQDDAQLASRPSHRLSS